MILKLDNLAERTGCRAFAFVTRGHVNNTTVPGWIEMDDSLSFISEATKKTPAELAHLFELWACSKTKGISKTPC